MVSTRSAWEIEVSAAAIVTKMRSKDSGAVAAVL
jgi:hypothetical protein